MIREFDVESRTQLEACANLYRLYKVRIELEYDQVVDFAVHDIEGRYLNFELIPKEDRDLINAEVDSYQQDVRDYYIDTAEIAQEDRYSNEEEAV